MIKIRTRLTLYVMLATGIAAAVGWFMREQTLWSGAFLLGQRLNSCNV